MKDWLRGISSTRLLPESQRRMYAAETTENFRFVAKLLPAQSLRTLTSEDLTSDELQHELAEIGQFAEVAHGSVSPEFIWKNMESLSQPGFPLDGYDALRESELISAFHGTVARLQGYIAYQPLTKQIIVAFSGTSSLSQTFHNFDVRHVAYPGKERCAIHRGFWDMYNGVRSSALGDLAKALPKYDVKEIVCTGHSMGAVMCYMFALDIMGDMTGAKPPNEYPTSFPLKLALFGSPRLGNQAFMEHWQRVVASHNDNGQSVKCYSVKGYNDGQGYKIPNKNHADLSYILGVPNLPPQHLRYRHCAQTPLYFAHGRLYHIPRAESEYSAFKIEPSATNDSKTGVLEYPLGGHNYYNGRDMEKLLRNMWWFDGKASGEVDWEQYGDWLRKEEERIRTQPM